MPQPNFIDPSATREPFAPLGPPSDPIDESFLEPRRNPFLEDLQPTFDPLSQIPQEEIEKRAERRIDPIISEDPSRGLPPPRTVIGRFFDLFLRPGFGVAKFVDQLVNEPGVALGRAASEAFKEVFRPSERLTMEDVIERANPIFSKRHPVASGVLGFALDVATDPLNALLIGPATKAARIPNIVRGNLNKLSGPAREAVQETLSRSAIAPPEKLKKSLIEPFMRGQISPEEAAAASVDRLLEGRLITETLDFGAEGTRKLRARAGTPLSEKEFTDALEFERLFDDLSEARRSRNFFNPETGEFIRQQGFKILTPEGQRLMGRLTQAKVDQAGPKGLKLIEPFQELGDVATVSRRKEQIRGVWDQLAVFASDPQFGKDLVKTPPLLSFAKIPIIPGRVREVINSSPLIQSLKEKVKDFSLVAVFNKGLRGNADIPPVLQTAMQEMASVSRNAPLEVMRSVRKMFKGATEEERERIARAGIRIEEDIRDIQKTQGRNITPAEMQGITVRAMGEFNITDHLKSMFADFTGTMQDLKFIEKEAGLLTHEIAGYVPRIHDVLSDPAALSKRFREFRVSPDPTTAPFFGPDQSRTIQSILDHETFTDPFTGRTIKPVLDAAIIMANRRMESARALQRAINKNLVERLIPGVRFDTKAGKLVIPEGPELRGVMELYGVKSPARAKRMIANIADRVTFLQEGIYSNVNSETAVQALGWLDRATALWRSSATVWKPGFSLRQFPAGFFQAFLRAGPAQSANYLNPKSMMDSFLLMSGRASDMGPMRSVVGEPLDYRRIQDELVEFNVVRNATVEGLTTPNGNILTRATTPKEMTRLLKQKTPDISPDPRLRRGMAAMFKDITRNYMNFPMVIEDTLRTNLFVNLRKQGHTPVEALRLVDESHFDYFQGLSRFEQTVARRLIPFYSFNRFSLGLAAQVATHSPGRVANLARFGEQLLNIYGKFQTGEELTPEERSAIPGWLMDSVGGFRGFNELGEANFWHITSTNPLDAIAMLRPDPKTGAIDLKESATNGAMAQMSPFIKVPIEAALGKEFFTGRMIDDNSTELGIDPDRFLTTLMGMVGAGVAARVPSLRGFSPTATGLTAAAVTAGATQTNPEVSKRVLGGLLGFEEGLNEKGEQTTFFSPFRFFVMRNALPGLNDAIRFGRTDLSPKERTAAFLFGVPTTTVDLQESALRRIRGEKGEVTREKNLRDKALLEERWESARRHDENLRILIKELEIRNRGIDLSQIRGFGNPELPDQQ